MALAARATASFPFAFEPVFLPVGTAAPSSTDDMSDVRRAGRPRRRRTVALRGRRRRAGQHPHPGGARGHRPPRRRRPGAPRHAAGLPARPGQRGRPCGPARPPTDTVGGLSAVLGALQSQGGRTYVERIEEHNRAAADWRGGRLHVLTTSATTSTSLFALAEVAWRPLRRPAHARAALDLTERVPFFVTEARRPFEYVRRRPRPRSARCSLPVRPAGPPAHEGPSEPGWHWGYTTALGVADGVAEILRAALGSPPRTDAGRCRRGSPRSPRSGPRSWTRAAHRRHLARRPLAAPSRPDDGPTGWPGWAYRGDLLAHAPDDATTGTSSPAYAASRRPETRPAAGPARRPGCRHPRRRPGHRRGAGRGSDRCWPCRRRPRGVASRPARLGHCSTCPTARRGDRTPAHPAAPRARRRRVARGRRARRPAPSLPIKLVQLSLRATHPWVVRTRLPGRQGSRAPGSPASAGSSSARGA